MSSSSSSQTQNKKKKKKTSQHTHSQINTISSILPPHYTVDIYNKIESSYEKKNIIIKQKKIKLKFQFNKIILHW